MFMTAKDKFRLKKLEVYNDKSKKLQDVRIELETALETNLTDEYRKKLSKLSERLTSLQIEYEAAKESLKELKSMYEPEPEDQELEEQIIMRKKISLTDICIFSISDSSLKVKLIPQLSLSELHEFTLSINTSGDQVEIKSHNLPPFIPYKMSFKMKHGNKESIQIILSQIICYLECYLVRRENVMELKKQFLGLAIRSVETSSSFNMIIMSMDIAVDEDMFELRICLHYLYDNIVANEVHLQGIDGHENVLEDMKESSNIFLTEPLIAAFNHFATH